MSALITLPRMGETMESGRVAAWLKKPGDAFERGETLLEIETDKVTVEVPALDSGRMTEILAPEGAEIAVGEPLARYDAAGAPAATPPARPNPPPAAADRTPPSPPAQGAPAAALADLVLPRMGETMEEGRLAAWLKRPGDAFKRGEVLAEIETDKVTVEMPALADGELAEILVDAGASAAVGAPIARYRPAGAAAPAPRPPAAPAPAAASQTAAAPQPAAAPQAAAPAPALPSGATTQAPFPRAEAPARRRATPLARRLARAAGLDLAALAGTGRRGRIGREDVEAAAGRGGAVQPPQSTLPELRYATLPQGRMAYREWAPAGAARRSVLLLHGFAADGGTWGSVASALARGGARVVAPDLPAHGATAVEAHAFDDLLGAAAGFADALGLGGAEVLAHSMGGAVAARLAATGRLRPAALTLVAPAGLGDEIDGDFVAGMAAARTGGALAHLLRRLARRAPNLSRPQLDAMAAEFGRGRLADLATDLVQGGRQGVDIVPDLAALALPVRIVWGTGDRIIPWTQAAAAPSRVAVHLIAGAGHMPHWDSPQDFAALMA